MKFQRFILFLFSQVALITYAAGPKQTIVTCYIHGYQGSAVFLYEVENGEAVSLGFKRPDSQGACTFSVSLKKEAVCFLRKAGSHQFEFNHVLYLKPGDKKTIHLYSNYLSLDFDSSTILDPNRETTFLEKWTQLFNSTCKLGFNYRKREGFFRAYDELTRNAARLKKDCTSNEYFNKLFASKINTDLQFAKAAVFFGFNERMNSTYDSSDTHRLFYQSLSAEKICREDLLQSERGMQLLDYFLVYNSFQRLRGGREALAVPFAQKARQLTNNRILGVYVFRRMKAQKSFEQFVSEIEPFEREIITAGFEKKYRTRKHEMYTYAKGAPAYNFSLHDVNNRLVSLSDFKGKMVVVDIWAMWCAPCLAEKPYFQKMEDEFKDNNHIVFVSVSVDGNVKKDAWKYFVAKKAWKGIELLSNFDESLMKYYQIEGIPRFMIFDKEGKIVSIDAPRPSGDDFRKLIEQTLKENG